MDAQALLAERKQLFDNCLDFKHNKRVPMMSNFFTWKIYDAGYTVKETLYDYEISEKVNRHFIETYQFDAYFDLCTRNPMRVTSAFGGGYHYIDEKYDTVLIDDHEVMFREDYQDYMANRQEFFYSKALKRMARPGVTVGEMKNAVMELLAFGQFSAKQNAMLRNEYGGLNFGVSAAGLHPFELLFNAYRGMKGLALDLRKCKDEVKEWLDFVWQTETLPGILSELDLDDSGCVATMMFAFLGHSILSNKQFEELYYPYCKQVIDLAIEHKKRIAVMCEAEMLRLAEFFEDVPKGVFIIQLEQDNIFEYRKRLPNIAITGGMPTELLGYGTKEQCIDYAKRLIDELGEGYAFGTTKMMSYKDDAKAENLKAVCDFVREYEY